MSTALYAEENRQTELPKWELGVGVGAISLPHYRGADQSQEYISPVPYVRYNGKRLKIDREGGSFYFYKGENVHLDVSLAFAFPLDSNDNRTRAGMNDLDSVIEIGPRILVDLLKSNDKNLRLRFALPLRTAYATDFNQTENIGLVLSPYLEVRYVTSAWETEVAIGPMWANERYHDYYYEVGQQDVTATRAAYNAKAGYSGSRLTLTTSKRVGELYFGVFARYDDLTGASFIDSPLVKKENSLMLGFALSWVFKSVN